METEAPPGTDHPMETEALTMVKDTAVAVAVAVAVAITEEEEHAEAIYLEFV